MLFKKSFRSVVTMGLLCAFAALAGSSPISVKAVGRIVEVKSHDQKPLSKYTYYFVLSGDKPLAYPLEFYSRAVRKQATAALGKPVRGLLVLQPQQDVVKEKKELVPHATLREFHEIDLNPENFLTAQEKSLTKPDTKVLIQDREGVTRIPDAAAEAIIFGAGAALIGNMIYEATK